MTLDDKDIVKLIDGYEKESKAYREEAIRFCWYMRGGINYDDAMLLSAEERDIIGKLIKENLKVTKESGLPFF